MSAVSVQIKKEASDSPRFSASAGNRQSVGQTMGEALDALLAEWEIPIQQADVCIEEADEKTTQENYIEPYLINEGGFWVIAGGEFSPDDAKRDFVAEMRDERLRSFFSANLQGEVSE